MASAQDWAAAHVAGSNQFAAESEGPAILPDLSLASVSDRAAQSGLLGHQMAVSGASILYHVPAMAMHNR